MPTTRPTSIPANSSSPNLSLSIKRTFPSKPITFSDIPEVRTVSGQFIYNFFTTVERLDDSGRIQSVTRPGETIESSVVVEEDINNSVPRYISLTWDKVKLETGTVPRDVTISRYFNAIHYEYDFLKNDFLSMLLQDTAVDNKLTTYITNIKQTASASFMELARATNTITDTNVNGQTLADVLTNPKLYNNTFFKRQEDSTQTIQFDSFQDVKDVRFSLALNGFIVNDIYNNLFFDSVSPYVDELQQNTLEFKQTQNAAESSRTSNAISSEEFELNIKEYIKIRQLSSDYASTTTSTIGYVIDKEELAEDGRIIKHNSIIVEGSNTTKALDFKVKYSSTYIYRVRTIAYVELIGTLDDRTGLNIVGLLISSKPSPDFIVKTEELIPPPPPSDFNINWDYKEKCPRIFWSFPVNRQRDIKMFQVFRRKTIKEPFELIRMYNFDDSLISSPYNETPSPALITRELQTYFLDREFTKDSKYIYAVASIDAHGFVSNYSMQFEVWFDRIENKLKKKLISVSGAPRAYPNMYLQQEVFVDSIKDENHDSLRIVFNPEFLKVVDGHNNDKSLLKTGTSGNYKIQIINIDLQQEQTLTINLRDLTTNRSILRNSGQ